MHKPTFVGLEYIPLYFIFWGSCLQTKAITQYSCTQRNVHLSLSTTSRLLTTMSLSPVHMRALRERLVILLKLTLRAYMVALRKNRMYHVTLIVLKSRLIHTKFLKLILLFFTRTTITHLLQLHTRHSHGSTTPKLYARRKRRLYRRAYQT